MNYRRKNLVALEANDFRSTNAGLWLDKYFGDPNPKLKKEDLKRVLVKQTSQIIVPTVYHEFFKRWERMLDNEHYDAKCKEIEINGRMAVGLGGDSVIETHITLHRTYGVPYIPGSALKGLALRYAWNRLEKSKDEWTREHTQTLFGCDEKGKEAAGFVTFFDALYVPKPNAVNRPLAPDVMTVHHSDYYNDGTKPPADWDDPTPVSFLSATGKYLLAVAAPDAPEWREVTLTILEKALDEEGIGAKTSSGYGRMQHIPLG
jgi:CRISPR-associated protein Cmr6